VHYQPQQSVLKPQFGHRQTACIRYISAWPHRSHSIFASLEPASVGPVVLSGDIGRVIFFGVSPEVGLGRSDIRAIIADAG